MLGFFQSGLGDFHAALDFFGSHHHFELAVIGFGNLGFGIGDFMLQRFVGFVGFYGAALIAILASAVFPLLGVKFEFLALGHDLSVRFFRGSHVAARPAKLSFRIADALRIRFQFRTQHGNLVVNALQLNKVRNRRMHG